jgi:very-short-patch-repair endonuclease
VPTEVVSTRHVAAPLSLPPYEHPTKEGALARIADVLAEYAGRQHGVITRRQLLAAGVTRDVVDGCVRRRELRTVHAGVYQAGPVAGPRAREMAAVLACGGVLSHRSAAVMRQLAAAPAGDPFDIAVQAGRRVVRPGLRVHRCVLDAGDVEEIDGVPVTTLPRTVFDFAGVATAREVEQALAIAERTAPKLLERLQQLLHRHPARRGTRMLRELLRRGAPALTRSAAEELLLELIRSAALPEPETNVMVHGHEVDCYWRAARLVVEVDGYAWHGTRRAYVRDRQRDSVLVAAGIRVLRLSWQQLTRERDRTLVQLALATARASGSPSRPTA